MPTSRETASFIHCAELCAAAEALPGPVGRRLVFDRPDQVWLVIEGCVDLFAVQYQGGQQSGPLVHVGRLAANSLVWGIDQTGGNGAIRLRAVPDYGARLMRLPIGALAGLVAAGTDGGLLVAAVERWIQTLSDGIVQHIAPRRDPEMSILAGDETQVPPNVRIGSRRGVVWAQPGPGCVDFLDVPAMVSDGSAVVPLTPHSWVVLRDGGRLSGHDTAGIVAAGDLVARMRRYHRWVFDALAVTLRAASAIEAERIALRESDVALQTERTLDGLATLLDANPLLPISGEHGNDDLFECCALVGRSLGTAMVMPLWATRSRPTEKPLRIEDIAAASQIRVRQVILRGRWWDEDNGPLVGQLEADARPVALLSRDGTSYVVYDPSTGMEGPVNDETVEQVSSVAYCFYPSLPARALSAFDLLRFGLGRSRKDLVRMAAIGSLGGVMMTLIPLATGYVFDSVIPGHQTPQLFQLALALLVAAFAATGFTYARDVAKLRIESRVFGTLQAAVMDRLLRLPGSFFSGYSSGDLAQRVMAVEIIRNHLGETVGGALVSGVFSMFNFAVLFFYSPVVGAAAVGLVLILAVVVFFTARRLLEVTTIGADLSGKVGSLVYELLSGIAKLRLAGAEGRAFNRWGGLYREMQRSEVKAAGLANQFATFWAGYELIGLAAIFTLIATLSGRDISTGIFLALIMAFTSLMLALGGLAQAAIEVVAVVPLYRRALPILRAAPERDIKKADPGILSGGFDVSNLCFRYSPDSPRVLDGVTFSARPGQFIALVGPSGSGKSTLLRLLLGFNLPESGGVFFDGHDLRSLDLQLVRSQIGVVLQHGRLMPGTIEENIRGGSRATLDECWEATAAAGLDADIRAMPMGMHTVLTEGTATVSGGQAQRILIARAIVANPRLLLLDEATSAIDNRTQAVVTESLDRLLVTRVVIAHRLSTIMKADRIFVLSHGRIVEAGPYDEVLALGGVFADLVRRQTI